MKSVMLSSIIRDDLVYLNVDQLIAILLREGHRGLADRLEETKADALRRAAR